MPAARYGQEHRRARRALLAQWPDGAPCARCGHPTHKNEEKLALDHSDDGSYYLGFSHDSPCQICGERCNSAAGGRHRAQLSGYQLRSRRCLICGKPYEATSGSAGAEQVTCGGQPCITEIRRIRKRREPDPEPPPATGRVW